MSFIVSFISVAKNLWGISFYYKLLSHLLRLLKLCSGQCATLLKATLAATVTTVLQQWCGKGSSHSRHSVFSMVVSRQVILIWTIFLKNFHGWFRMRLKSVFVLKPKSMQIPFIYHRSVYLAQVQITFVFWKRQHRTAAEAFLTVNKQNFKGCAHSANSECSQDRTAPERYYWLWNLLFFASKPGSKEEK